MNPKIQYPVGRRIRDLRKRQRIAGRNLRGLAVGFQERAVEWVMPVPEKHAEAWEGGQGLIRSIAIE
jgi:hypothetical protein